jgi:hypothetical protein
MMEEEPTKNKVMNCTPEDHHLRPAEDLLRNRRRQHSKKVSQISDKSGKKWTTSKTHLLVRSLSDSARHIRPNIDKQIQTKDKCLTLSLSDSRLFTKSSAKKSLVDILNLETEEPECCSCGCEKDLENDYSEDEGCFVISSVPPRDMIEVETDKVNFIPRFIKIGVTPSLCSPVLLS